MVRDQFTIVGSPFAEPAPVPPQPLLRGKLGIAGLGDGAAKDVEATDVVLLAGALAEPVIEFRALMPR